MVYACEFSIGKKECVSDIGGKRGDDDDDDDACRLANIALLSPLKSGCYCVR